MFMSSTVAAKDLWKSTRNNNFFKSLLFERGDFFVGAFMRGNKPLVLPGVKEGFSKAETGELKASPNSLDNI